MIVSAVPADVGAIAELMEELDRFYGIATAEPIEQRAERIRSMVFREHPAAYVLLAKESGRLVGLAAYSFHWPATRLTQSLYLKELFVSGVHRRTGVGKQLMERVMQVARDNGCSRVDWTADADNPLALGFYRKLGYAEPSGRVVFRANLQ